MGAVVAKFRKKAKTTAEVLEGLEENIRTIEKYTLNTQEQKKRFVGNFLAISIGVYVLAFIIFYFVYFPPTWKERFVHSVPLLLFPLVIILLRRLFTWYFQRKLNKNSNKLTALRAEKKKILEQVMDKETYKVAVNLLNRFGERTNGNKYSFSMTPRLPATQNQSLRAIPIASSSTSQLNTTTSSIRTSTLNTPISATPRQIASLPQMSSGRQLALTPQTRTGQELRRRTPFPIVNQQDKGVFERIVDVLIGDGPGDRFAMICKECFAHNGMALKEEFDYATFRCAFCHAMNPSRKARPVAPRLPIQQGISTRIAANRHSSDSSSSSSDDEEFDNEHKDDDTFELNADGNDVSSQTKIFSAEMKIDTEDFKSTDNSEPLVTAKNVQEENEVACEKETDQEGEQQQQPDDAISQAVATAAASKLKDELKREM